MTKASFTGFSPKLVKFLKDLDRNNNRDWFQKNKQRFEDDVQGPFLEFLEALEPELAKVAPHVVVVAKKAGGSMQRIYRDTRFSKDKSPYQTHVAARLTHEVGKKKDAPGYYVNVNTKNVMIGTGIWQPEPPALAKLRKRIAGAPKDWQKIIGTKAFRDAWGRELYGEQLKRVPKGFDPEHPCADDLRRKGYCAITELSHKQLTQKDFVKRVAKAWKASHKLNVFICDALGLPW